MKSDGDSPDKIIYLRLLCYPTPLYPAIAGLQVKSFCYSWLVNRIVEQNNT